jgi:hypothetical protein
MMVRNITAEVYAVIAPQLGVHSICRAVASIAAGAAAALGVEAELVFEADYSRTAPSCLLCSTLS